MKEQTTTPTQHQVLAIIGRSAAVDGSETETDSWSADAQSNAFWTNGEASVYRSCVGALMYYVLDRADAQLEVSILGSSLRTPTTGALEALCRVTRYLLGMQVAYTRLRVRSREPVLLRVDADGCPSASFSRRQLRGDEQRHGSVLCTVLDCGVAVAFEGSTGTLRVPREHDSLL